MMYKKFAREYKYNYELTPPEWIRESEWFKYIMDRIGIYGGDEKIVRPISEGFAQYLVKTGWVIPKFSLVIWETDKYK